MKELLNKIHHADCLEFMKQLPDKCVDLVLTDPPYGMAYQSSWRIDKYDKIENDSDLNWLTEFASDIYRVLKDDTHIYIFCNEYTFADLFKAMEGAGFNRKRLLVWIKNNHTSGDLMGDYANITEYVAFFHKGRKELIGKRENNLLHFDRVPSEIHPTQKPLQILKHLCKKSLVNGVVLDCFSGSGTTALACHDLGLDFICIEKDADYHKASVERLEQHKRQMRLL